MKGYLRQSASQQGFTLLEIMVVVVIVAVLAGATVVAFNQAFNRPYQAKVRELESWLQVISDRAVLEGTAYGVRQDDQELKAMVYYRQHWFPVNSPEPFTLRDMKVIFNEEALESAGDKLPAWIISQFYTEGELILQSPDSSFSFSFSRNFETGSIQSENTDSEI